MLCTVVGAGPGLGAALVTTFADAGFDVAHLSRRPARVTEVLSGSPSVADRTRGFVADVDDPTGLADALEAAEVWAGPTSVLIYNAARMVADDVDTLSSEALTASMRTNVGAALQAVQHVLPGMRRAGHGTILLTGGGLGLEPYPHWASLGAGKAALRSVGIGLHKALAPEGIHVAVLAIGGVIDADGPLTPEDAATLFLRVHREEPGSWRREVVHLPPGADPYYNDPEGRYRSTSRPVESTGCPSLPVDEPG